MGSTQVSDLAREIEAAEVRGEQQAKLTADVAHHERRLNGINGSIERLANEMGKLRTTLTDVATRMATQEKLDEMRGEQERRVEDDRKEWKRVVFAALAGGGFVLLAAGISALVVSLA